MSGRGAAFVVVDELLALDPTAPPVDGPIWVGDVRLDDATISTLWGDPGPLTITHVREVEPIDFPSNHDPLPRERTHPLSPFASRRRASRKK